MKSSASAAVDGVPEPEHLPRTGEVGTPPRAVASDSGTGADAI